MSGDPARTCASASSRVSAIAKTPRGITPSSGCARDSRGGDGPIATGRRAPGVGGGVPGGHRFATIINAERKIAAGAGARSKERKRLEGFEPSTFCMASSLSRAASTLVRAPRTPVQSGIARGVVP
jgi:hypothetical protein